MYKQIRVFDPNITTMKRVTVVDALRGFALIGIVLIHAVEHFDFFRQPEVRFIFSESTDRKVMEIMFILISGKAYSIFALMFGFSFFVQMERQKHKGMDFRWRFLWRLTILFTMGIAHSLVYKGDILHIYAALGVLLLLADRFGNRILSIMAIMLALQIPMIVQLITAIADPDHEFVRSFGSGLWQEANELYASGSLLEIMNFNAWKGRTMTWGWTFYNGRYLQLIALFIWGLVLGRKEKFANNDQNRRFWVWILGSSIAGVLILFIGQKIEGTLEFSQQASHFYSTILKSYAALAWTFIIVSGFILISFSGKIGRCFNVLAAYGRMSLSNYLFQSLFGTLLFFGFGFGMYRYMGSTWSLIYGIFFVTLQLFVSSRWFKHFHYGPFEWLWRRLTFFTISIPFRKNA